MPIASSCISRFMNPRPGNVRHFGPGHRQAASRATPNTAEPSACATTRACDTRATLRRVWTRVPSASLASSWRTTHQRLTGQSRFSRAPIRNSTTGLSILAVRRPLTLVPSSCIRNPFALTLSENSMRGETGSPPGNPKHGNPCVSLKLPSGQGRLIGVASRKRSWISLVKGEPGSGGGGIRTFASGVVPRGKLRHVIWSCGESICSFCGSQPKSARPTPEMAPGTGNALCGATSSPGIAGKTGTVGERNFGSSARTTVGLRFATVGANAISISRGGLRGMVHTQFASRKAISSTTCSRSTADPAVILRKCVSVTLRQQHRPGIRADRRAGMPERCRSFPVLKNARL